MKQVPVLDCKVLLGYKPAWEPLGKSRVGIEAVGEYMNRRLKLLADFKRFNDGLND
jgi:hypothetical protein